MPRRALAALVLAPLAPLAAALSAADLAASYGLTASYNFSFPTTTLDSTDANSWLKDNWDMYKGKVDFGQADIVFSPDPDTTTATLVRRAHSSTSSSSASSAATSKASTKSSSSSSSSSSASGTATSVSYPASTDLAGEAPVLRIEYPQGSYSSSTGGTQFYARPLNASSGASASAAAGNASSDGQYERMMLSYDIWFPTGFAFNQGGKLPGLRGGPDDRGCSGGSQTNGTGCFSTRLMWRASGEGEVYAYIPTTQKNFCSQTDITCNSDYGTSLARGSFSFATGQWQTIWLVVMLNEVGIANGVVELYYNGVKALSFANLEIRSAASLESIGGLYFSTFFGGSDSSWATPTTQYTYFRNMELYAGLGAANGTGSAISAAPRAAAYTGSTPLAAAAVVAVGAALVVVGW